MEKMRLWSAAFADLALSLALGAMEQCGASMFLLGAGTRRGFFFNIMLLRAMAYVVDMQVCLCGRVGRVHHQ